MSNSSEVQLFTECVLTAINMVENKIHILIKY